MKVAVAGFGDEVSHRLDCSTCLVLVELEEGRYRDLRVADVGRTSRSDVVGILRRRGVQLLVCGGIREQDIAALSAARIDVIWGVIGRVDVALGALLDGVLHNDMFVVDTGISASAHAWSAAMCPALKPCVSGAQAGRARGMIQTSAGEKPMGISGD